MEEWLDIINYEGKYQVSTLGNIKSLNYNNTNKPKNLIPRINKKGRRYINLCINGKYTSYVINRLVAIAFIQNPDNLPEVNHIDGNKLNDSKDNLEWCTRLYNSEHAKVNNLYCSGDRNGRSKILDSDIVKIKEMYKNGNITQKQIGKLFNVTREHISQIVNNKKRNNASGGQGVPQVS